VRSMPRQSRRRWEAQAVRAEIQEVNSLTCKGALSRGKGVSDGPVQHPLGPPSLYGAGVHHLFWSTNAILIHVNVAVWRSADSGLRGGQGWFFGEVIRKRRSLNAAETLV
jgi:hypothetical protein